MTMLAPINRPRTSPVSWSAWALATSAVLSLLWYGTSRHVDGMYALWSILCALSAASCFVADSPRWRLLTAAIAASMAPSVGGYAFLARLALPMAAVYFVQKWPFPSRRAGLAEGVACWPWVSAAGWALGWYGPLVVDAVGILIVIAASFVAAIRIHQATALQRYAVYGLFGLVVLSGRTAIFCQPDLITTTVVFSPIVAVALAPLVLGLWLSPQKTLAVILGSMLVLAWVL